VAAGETGDAPEGKRVFLDHKCNICHTVKAEGIALKEVAGTAGEEAEETEPAEEGAPQPPDLSSVGKRHDAAFLHKFLRKKEKIDGRLHRRRFQGTEKERQALVDWLVTLKVESK
jgi:cytochrome c2